MNTQKINKEIETNKVCIAGIISSGPVFSHEVFGERFYTMCVDAIRVSGTVDAIPVIVSERLFDVTQDYCGMEVVVTGQFRSRNRHDGTRNRLILSVFAFDIDFEPNGHEKGINEILIEGCICKNPVYRITPSGREIADIMLAVNRDCGKSDYIPCICWGRNAVFASGLEIGSCLRVSGRIQSRDYNKKLENGNIEVRTAYEVSIRKMEVVN